MKAQDIHKRAADGAQNWATMAENLRPSRIAYLLGCFIPWAASAILGLIAWAVDIERRLEHVERKVR